MANPKKIPDAATPEADRAQPLVSDLVSLKVLSPIDHDGVRYQEGEDLIVGQAVAARLLGGGSAGLS